MTVIALRPRPLRLNLLFTLLATVALAAASSARTPGPSSPTVATNATDDAKAAGEAKAAPTTTAKSSATAAHVNKATTKARTTHRRRHHHRRRYVEHFTTSSYAEDITAGDVTAGEDPIVRQAAVEALGNMNGTLVAIDPDTGRILTMVNQQLALSEGAQPCSTIKIAIALAALREGVIDRETPIRIGRRSQINLTDALAHSNNAYFEAVGRRLGFAKVSYYAREFGLGELAGFNIPGEHPGVFPSTVIPASLGGVGKMCSFGEGISLTPLQLGALVSAIANGGTLYYLQHPASAAELAAFRPRIKRTLPIAGLIPEISYGMEGAVDYGTARSLHLNFSEEQVLGKTGTCSRAGTRFGWFASFANTRAGRIVTVIFLQGGRPTYGPRAAEISGIFYRSLYHHNFFSAPATSARNSSSPDSDGSPSSSNGAPQ